MNVHGEFKLKYPEQYNTMNDTTANLTERILAEVAFKYFKAGWDSANKEHWLSSNEEYQMCM